MLTSMNIAAQLSRVARLKGPLENSPLAVDQLDPMGDDALGGGRRGGVPEQPSGPAATAVPGFQQRQVAPQAQDGPRGHRRIQVVTLASQGARV